MAKKLSSPGKNTFYEDYLPMTACSTVISPLALYTKDIVGSFICNNLGYNEFSDSFILISSFSST